MISDHFSSRQAAPTDWLRRKALLLGLLLLGCSGDDPTKTPLAPDPYSALLGTTLLVNPGFEAGGLGWQKATNGGRSIVSTVVHTGSGAQQISGTSAYGRVVYQDVALTAGGDYDAVAWVSTSGLAGGASVELYWLTTAGVVDPAPTNAVLRKDVLGVLSNTAPWTQFTGNFTAPAGAAAVRFMLVAAREPDGKGTAWFDDADLTAAAPAPQDTLPPAVTMTQPTDGAVVSSAVLLEATASDDIGVAGVQFQIDGMNVGVEDASSPYQLLHDISSLPNGAHTITAIARDAAGNTTISAAVAVTVQQMPELVVDPGFESNGTNWQKVGLSGRTVVSTTAHSGSRSLQLVVSSKYERLVFQDVPILAGRDYDISGWVAVSGLGGSGASIALTWLTGAGLPDPAPSGTFFPDLLLGSYSGSRTWTSITGRVTPPSGAVVARVRLRTAPEPDGSGSAWFDDLSLRPVPGGAQDVTPPTVAISAPSAGSVLTGMATISASASDEIAVAGVRFQMDGVDVGTEDLTAPFDLMLDTPAYTDGDHIISAIARDPSGNTATAAGVTVRFANAGRPNIVLVLVDDLRYDLMSYLPLTSALLQPEAVQFTRAFQTTPECCPSRASILTGLYSHNTGVLQNYGVNGGAPRFNPSSTIATWLASAGYRTGLYGKYLNAYNLISPAVPAGWSEFHAFVGNDDDEYYNFVLNRNGTLSTYGSTPDQYSTTILSGLATQFITSTPLTRPLFLFFTPFAPHAPAIPEPGDIGAASSFPDWRPAAFNEADVSDKPAWVQALPLLTPTEIAGEDLFHQQQLESIQSVDRAVAGLIAALQQTGRWSNTLFIFTSDNGLSWGEHRLRGKSCLYEECVRVPLWVRAPGIAPASDTNLVAGIDLAPTMAAWAQITPASRVNGSSLLPLLANPNGAWRTELLLEYLASPSPTTTFDGVRTPQFVYGEYLNGDKELYDLSVDPDQLQNIVTDPAYAATVAALQTSLIMLRAQ